MEKREYTKEYLRYNFSETEKKELASQMSLKALEVEDLESTKKSVMSSFKDKIDAAQLEVRSCATKIKDGWEFREIECEIVRDYENGKILTIRTDTGEKVREKEMTYGERQRHLDELLKREGKEDETAETEKPVV